MNIQYAKTILYAYPKIENTVKSYDKKIERKALDAMLDKRSCLTICDEIIDLKLTKAALFDIGVITTKILAKFSKEELDCIRYKYFKINVEGLDTTSRRYFHVQNRIIKKFARALEIAGVTDEVFESELMKDGWIRAWLKAVVQRDRILEAAKKKRKATMDAKMR